MKELFCGLVSIIIYMCKDVWGLILELPTTTLMLNLGLMGCRLISWLQFSFLYLSNNLVSILMLCLSLHLCVSVEKIKSPKESMSLASLKNFFIGSIFQIIFARMARPSKKKRMNRNRASKMNKIRDERRVLPSTSVESGNSASSPHSIA